MILHFDTETTGLDAVKNDIIQLGLIMEVNGVDVEKHDLKCQPFDYSAIKQEALDIHGYSVEDIKKFPPPEEMYNTLLAMLKKYIPEYSRPRQKFYPAGYNLEFDINFLTEFFKKNGDDSLVFWQNYRKLDPLSILFVMDYRGQIRLDNYKLLTVCNYFGIKIKAHDALSDIEATRKLLYKLLPYISDKKIKGVVKEELELKTSKKVDKRLT